MARKNTGRPTHHNSLEIEGSDGYFSPIRLNEGTLVTTPEKGGLEFNDGHLSFTPESERYAISLSNSVVTSNTTVTNTAAETSVHSKIFPANTFHEDHVIKATVYGSVTNASASDDYIVRFKLGGETLHTLSRVGGNVTDNGWVLQIIFTVRSTGATGTVVDFVELREGAVSLSSADVTVHTIDTTAALTLDFTVQWANAKVGNIFTSSQGFIEILH